MERLPEYEAAKKLEAFCRYVPEKDVARDYMHALREAYQDFLYMVRAMEEDGLETVNYEARAIVLEIEVFYIENV